MLVYRVEHERHPTKGAYKILLDILDSSAGSDQPSPDEDTRWRARTRHVSQLTVRWQHHPNQANYYFGFKSLKQARAWFGKIRADDARVRGAIVRVYRVRRCDVLKGYQQVTFRHDRARAVATLDISILSTRTRDEIAQDQVEAYRFLLRDTTLRPERQFARLTMTGVA